MNFKEATDILFAHVGADELANALGISVQSIRQARLQESNKGYRSPPLGWEKAVIMLAKQQAKHLTALADKLSNSKT